ncbi:MAG: SMC-Scp complex subunit ScpB [Clostridia bacterium]|nr:SMC-Scp complex subunit ScpB [Clostridia bacterium]MBQ2518352.1 SMC-Scp complex subunit ScpB [Clostridia bacterium]MBQ4342194.1 SMC-Scp complex subunit ScpB [Clostridia bacterium]
METTNENALPAGAADLEREELMGALESVLFIAGEPLPKAELTRVFQMNALELNVLLGELESELASAKRGIRLFTTDDTVQLVSAPEYNDWLVRLLAPPQEKNLSDSMMETLSVIAYRQPVTRADIEAVRGVRCEYAVSQLLKQGFIRELGRKDAVGRPMLFGTTDAFLRRFGLHSLEELPPMPEIENDEEPMEV